MKAHLIDKLATVVLIIIMAVNAFMLIRTWSLMNTNINTNVVLRENKATYILPDGFAPGKTKVSWDESLPTPSGWVVRYASSGCIYCVQDSEWDRLVSQLGHLNYRTILLLPRERDQFDEDQIISQTMQQMAFVKMDWIKQFRFTGTPTVVIFDNNGHVLWHRIGMLNEADYESAEKVITRNVRL
jgi:hypothetical protein